MTTTHTPAARVSGTIRQLEWTEGTLDDGRRKWTTDGELITESHPSWPADRQGFYLFHAGVALATIGEAKEHAQLRQNARIAAAIQPDPEPQPVAWRYRPVDKKSPWSNVTEHRRTAYGRIGMEEQPLYATPSSAGTVSVEAAIQLAQKFACEDVGFEIALRALAGEGKR